ncbi:hypothetical protein [Pseudomonas sp. efr-133-TYG-5]|jgi:hypothetical protein|uniref:hypothetical protein n=1 Tax=Pseudomonas sp. efr-133-TYG-5 TaxID=3040310 RepID=UPI0025558FAC|nr:hypothetical protein [Pseudomonas sp. efr-133-TYG-5]
MSKSFDNHVLSSALDTLVRSPLDQADGVALVNAAKEVWYTESNLENEVKAFLACHQDETERRRAAYLLERFTRFACVSDNRVSETLHALELFIPTTPKQNVMPQQSVSLRNRWDELAVAWGLKESLGLKIQALMPFQTRHYEAELRSSIS